MIYEDVYEFIGQIGVFQLCACAGIILYCIFALDVITIIFVGADMPHWCRVEQLKNFSYDLQKDIAIPLGEDGQCSSCHMYDFHYDNYSMQDYLSWNRTVMVDNKTNLIFCSDWIYEQSTFISTIVSRFDLVCDWAFLVPLVSTVYMAGGLVGGAVGGVVADRLGRKTALLIFLVIKIVGIILSTFSPNYSTFTIGRFIMGVGSVACYNTSYVLTMELVGQRYRSVIGGSVQVATSIGFVFQPFIAYFVRHDIKYQVASLAPNVLILLIAFVVCESPRWLIVNGRYEEGEKILRQMCAINHTQLPEGFKAEMIKIEESPSGSFLLLFRFPVMRIRTLILCFLCFSSNLLYFSLSLNTGALTGDIYKNTLISSSLEIPANIICIVLVERKFFGRKFTTFWSYLFTGLSCLLCIPMVLLGIGMGETVLSIIGKAISLMAFTAMFISASEIFPTEVRNAGMGIIQTSGGVANLAASFIGEPLAKLWRPLPYVILGSFSIISALLTLALPETLGHPLPDTVAQAETFKGGKVPKLDEIASSVSNGSSPDDPTYPSNGLTNLGFQEDKTATHHSENYEQELEMSYL